MNKLRPARESFILKKKKKNTRLIRIATKEYCRLRRTYHVRWSDYVHPRVTAATARAGAAVDRACRGSTSDGTWQSELAPSSVAAAAADVEVVVAAWLEGTDDAAPKSCVRSSAPFWACWRTAAWMTWWSWVCAPGGHNSRDRPASCVAVCSSNVSFPHRWVSWMQLRNPAKIGNKGFFEYQLRKF